MSLKQSCFKSIVKSDIKRSWWISALAALFIFMSSTSPLFNRGYDYYSFPRFDDTLDFVNNMFMNYFVGGCVAAFAVLYLLVVQVICGLASGALLGQKLGENVLLAPPMLQKLPAMFTWPQLFTALIGGAVALLIVPVLRKALHK